jgi:rhodanese-related sulfurtransferase
MIRNIKQHREFILIKHCLLPLALLTGCGLLNATLNKKFNILTVKELEKKLNEGEEFIIVDCRKENTYAKSHIKGAINILISKFDETFRSIPKDKPVALICYLGIFSRVGTQKLVENGYSQVYRISGGMKAWESAHP